jgi:hypothetical protein
VPFSTMVDWMAASQLLLSGRSKSNTHTRSFRSPSEPSGQIYSTSTPSTDVRCAAQLLAANVGRLGRISLPYVSSSLAQSLQSGERGVFDDGLGEGDHPQ